MPIRDTPPRQGLKPLKLIETPAASQSPGGASLRNLYRGSCSLAPDDPAAAETDPCLARGGSYLSNADELACAPTDPANVAALQHPRDYHGPDVGIRCCQ